ncbi:transposon-encoded TnpW family protein [Eubacteriales bacterium OttesenSCG-928-K08]|nr:transposon-encoded TnpW family protein [Eubacteriales bacterium OttesenSCG-928-K08]
MQFQYTPVTNTNQPQNTQPVIMRRRLGSTTYRVNVHFSSTSRETMNDKILRMVKNEASGK